MVWFMYQTLNAVFHSFLNKFQRDSGCLRENLGKQTKVFPLCTDNNAGFPGAPHPTCSASSSLRPEQRQHSPSRTFSVLRVEHSHSLPCPQKARQSSAPPQAGVTSRLWVPHRDLPVPSVSHQPCLLMPFHSQLSQKPLTTSYRQFNSRAGLYLQTYKEDLNFNIILLSDLQGRVWLQYFALSTGTKLCVPAVA